MGERLNPRVLWPHERPTVGAGNRRRIEHDLNRRLPTMAQGGHTFALGLDEVYVEVGGRRWPLWRCRHCYAIVPGWLLDEGFVDRCSAPRLALPPATQHRDPRRTRQP